MYAVQKLRGWHYVSSFVTLSQLFQRERDGGWWTAHAELVSSLLYAGPSSAGVTGRLVCRMRWTSCVRFQLMRGPISQTKGERKEKKTNELSRTGQTGNRRSVKGRWIFFIATNDVPFLLPGIKSTGNYYSNGSSRHFRPARRPAPHCGDPGYQLFGQHSAKRKGQCDAAHGAARRDHTERERETGGKCAHGNRDGLRGALASSTIRSRYRITDESSPVVFNAPQTIRHVVKFPTHSRESALSPPLLIPWSWHRGQKGTVPACQIAQRAE